ncbi:MAG TPA: ion transporter [Methanomicrobiales archaeon]|nr:ion transporter [Methanomicrobiales archaeon]
MNIKAIKRRIYEIIEVASPGDSTSRTFDIFMMVIISLNVGVVMLETVDNMHQHYLVYFYAFDLVSVAIFTVEYGARIWTCTLGEQYKRPILGRIRYALTPMALIDLLAILPFYLPLLVAVDFRVLRVLRLARIFRILKMSRYSEAIKTLQRVFLRKKEELAATFFVLILLLIFTSSLMYYAEHDAQPDKFSSIPESLWWGVVTLATVGYGDVYPITILGKIIGGVVLMISIGLFALPAGIFASGFAEEMAERQKNAEIICPQCGRNINASPEGIEGGGEDTSGPPPPITVSR